MSNEFMVQLAKEYIQEMGIHNTQYVIVRHDNTENPHLHIVYNRIDNDLKLISVNHDYKRNVKVCKKLKDKYGLTYGEGKEKVKREKLRNPDKAKYYIHDAIKEVLSGCKNPADLRFGLKEYGIEIEYKHKKTTYEIEGVSGIRFRLRTDILPKPKSSGTVWKIMRNHICGKRTSPIWDIRNRGVIRG